MIIVTGHSQKLDGICFIARTDDCSEALRLLRDKWNSTYDDQVKLLKRENGDYLVWAEVADDVEFDADTPRREGFVLETRQFDTVEVDDGRARRVYVSPVLERMPW